MKKDNGAGLLRTSQRLWNPRFSVFRSFAGQASIYVAWVLFSASSLLSQNKVQFGLTPAMVVREFKPGEPFSVELEVSNGNSTPVLMRGLAMDFWYDDQNRNKFGPPGTFPQSASNWLEFVPTQIVVRENGSAKVHLIVTPPVGATGSFYAVAFLESKPELTEPAHGEKKALYTNIRLGTLMLFAAEKSQKYQVAVTDIKITPPGPDTSFNLDLQLANMSNTHIFPRSSLLVMDKDNHVVGKAQGEIRRFLPGEQKSISIPWSGNLKPGAYQAVVTLIYGNDQTVSKQVPFEVREPETTTALGPGPSVVQESKAPTRAPQ